MTDIGYFAEVSRKKAHKNGTILVTAPVIDIAAGSTLLIITPSGAMIECERKALYLPKACGKMVMKTEGEARTCTTKSAEKIVVTEDTESI